VLQSLALVSKLSFGFNAKITMKLKPFVISICFTSTLLVLGYFWLTHYKLGLVRFFDADEFMYSHWAYSMLQGNIPYKDFFIITTPLYMVFLAPLFWFYHGVSAIVAFRGVACVVAVSMGISLAWLFYELRKSWIALLAPLLLALLPMPQDKFMETRPDNLATVCVLLGFACLIRWYKTKKSTCGFAAGTLLALSLFILQKMLPLVTLAILLSLLASLSKHMHAIMYRMYPFLVGVSIPILIFGLWALSTGVPDVIWYEITKAPIEHTGIKSYTGVPWDFYFHPNSTYYGFGPGYITNCIMWIVAIVWAIFRLVNRPKLPDVLLGVSFLSGIFLFIFYVPLKFTQYLIPSGVCVALYTTDIIYVLWQKLQKHTVGLLLFCSLYCIGLVGAYHVFQSVTMPKFTWTNSGTLSKIDTLLKTIPKDSYVLDLEGRTTYFRDPYYVCCLPFGQFGPMLTRPLPSLADSLQKTKTKYIYQAEVDRISFQIPDDQAFIRANYKPTMNNELWIAKYW
jgi:hypothetical protein